MRLHNQKGVALTLAIIIILMMTALVGFIYVPPSGSNPGSYAPGAIASLAFNVFNTTRTLSAGRNLAYYRARAALVDAQERIRLNEVNLESDSAPTTLIGGGFSVTNARTWYFNLKRSQQKAQNQPHPREWVWVQVSSPITKTGSPQLGLRQITITSPDTPDDNP